MLKFLSVKLDQPNNCMYFHENKSLIIITSPINKIKALANETNIKLFYFNSFDT